MQPHSVGAQALNRAVKELPTEPILYITGAKLQEAHGDVKMVPKIINSAINKKLPSKGVIIDRETWLKDAETCEKASPPMLATCRAIVEAVIDTAVDERERKDTYHRDAEECVRRGSYETARAVLQHARTVFPDSERTWRALAQLEKEHGAPLVATRHICVHACTLIATRCSVLVRHLTGFKCCDLSH
jgi:pre-mRNA-processing factor 6